MKVSQAIVSSIASKSRFQNKIAARSSDIDDQLAKSLCQWSPCRCELAYGQSESFNFFRPGQNKLALARSVFGELENRRYGGRQVVTRIILLEPEQLRGYNDNIILLARVLNSMGLLTLRSSIEEKLPKLEVPDYSVLTPTEYPRPELASETTRILRAIEIHRQVLLLGLTDPLSYLCAMLNDVPLPRRLDISFATALKVLENRRFNLQFFVETDCVLEKEFASQQLRTISLAPSQAAAF